MNHCPLCAKADGLARQAAIDGQKFSATICFAGSRSQVFSMGSAPIVGIPITLIRAVVGGC